MRIGVDARTLLGNRSGVGFYLSNLVEHGAFDGHEVFAYTASDERCPDLSVPDGTSFHWLQFSPPTCVERVLGPAWPLWWLNVPVSRALRRDDVDLFFGPNFVQPVTTSRPSIVVVHDLIHRTYPRAHSKAYRLYLRVSLAGVLRCADHVVTVSEASRRDLLRYHPRLQGRVTVIYGAASSRYRPFDLSAETVTALREKYGLPERFVLYVGTIEPRKNLSAVVEALERISDTQRPAFVVVGEDRGDDGFSQAVRSSPAREDIYFTGYVEEDDLPMLYSMADAFVYPSLYEGFGLPVLEAMQSGTPVVASNRSSLPEVIGDAGEIVDPEDRNEVAEALRLVWSDVETKEKYVQQGLERARKFSWEKSAEMMSDVLYRTVR
jgi:glycosyltransferase involved in cell wall biosynthesis